MPAGCGGARLGGVNHVQRLLFTPGVVVVNVPYHLGVTDQGWLGAVAAPDQVGTTLT